MKEWAANCAKRDAWLKAALEDPAYWVLEEKILMKYEVSLCHINIILVPAGNFPLFPCFSSAYLSSYDRGRIVRKDRRRYFEHQCISIRRNQLQEGHASWFVKPTF